MEIHRVREFYFRPLCEDSETGDENDGSEETGTRDDDEERLAAKTSSVTPRPRARSVWNVDGELVTHSAIHVKYEPVSFIYDYFYRLSAWYCIGIVKKILSWSLMRVTGSTLWFPNLPSFVPWDPELISILVSLFSGCIAILFAYLPEELKNVTILHRAQFVEDVEFSLNFRLLEAVILFHDSLGHRSW